MMRPRSPVFPHVPPTHEGPRGKPVTRRTVLSRRDALTDEVRAELSRRIAENAGGLLVGQQVVALYAPKGSEVDTATIDAEARMLGARVVYPRIVQGQLELAFHEAHPSELVTAGFGLREPPDDAARVVISEITAFVMPGLAFDRAGGRIGWGRGHYDATLAAAPNALRIGVAFECQVLDHVPRDPHDALLHVVVTELAAYRTVE
ncbi:MAG: 5-formyltetrahydrofolate cyclo-ligase [Myxococcales bacterium]|nr:5-formyltetrahydrofolate cyclo-ligase [Myxococcales bacterium]